MTDKIGTLSNALKLAECDAMVEMQDYLSQYSISVRCAKIKFAELLSKVTKEADKSSDSEEKHKRNMLYVTTMLYMKETLKALQQSCDQISVDEIMKYELEHISAGLCGKMDETEKLLSGSPIYLIGESIDDIKLKTNDTDAFTTLQIKLHRSDPFSLMFSQMTSAMHRVIGEWMTIKRIVHQKNLKMNSTENDVEMTAEVEETTEKPTTENGEESKQPDAKKSKNSNDTNEVTVESNLPKWTKNEHIFHVVRWNSNGLTTKLLSKQLAAAIGKEQLQMRNDLRKETNDKHKNMRGQKGSLGKMLKTEIGSQLNTIAQDRMHKTKPFLRPNPNAKVTLEVPHDGQIDLEDSDQSDNTRKRAREPSADSTKPGVKAELTADQILRQYESKRLKGIAKKQRKDKKGGKDRKGSSDSYKGRNDGGKGKPAQYDAWKSGANDWTTQESYTNAASSGSHQDNTWPKRLGAPPGSIWTEGNNSWEKMKDGKNWYCFTGTMCGQTYSTKEYH